MKKTLLILLMTAALLGTITGTIAYFTDAVDGEAVMASGELSILQHEHEYAPDGKTLQPYTQSQMIYPGVPVDKIVTVENAGKNVAYVRTYFAIPTAGNGRTLASLLKGSDPNWVWAEQPLTDVAIDGAKYDIFHATYTSQLSPGATTSPAVTGFTVSTRLSQEQGGYVYRDDHQSVPLSVGEPFLILVASEASQAIVFEDAAQAMEATFSGKRHPWEEMVIAASQAELDKALQTTRYDTCIQLKDGTYTLPQELPAGIRINGMGLKVRLTNDTLAGYDIELDHVSFTKALTFTGHGSFQDVIFQAGCQAIPTTGDILFAHCENAPQAFTDTTSSYQVTIKN